MTGFLVPPDIVKGFLEKPYSLRDVWDKVAGGTGPKPSSEAYYTPAELVAVEQEKDRLYGELTRGRTRPAPDRKLFTLSAGGPGSGKSVLLEQQLISDPGLQNAVFADPDERALKLMKVYKDDIERFGGGRVGIALAYTKWRWASNYISNSIMNQAAQDGYDILHGTTATSPAISLLYNNVAASGYASSTLIIMAPEQVRQESARRRFEVEKTRYTADAVQKGHEFYQRLPVYFEKSDRVGVFWRDKVDGDAILAAEAENGIISVHDKHALKALDQEIRLYRPDLSWTNLADRYQSRFSL